MGSASHSRAVNLQADEVEKLVDSGILDHDTTIEIDIATKIVE